VTPCRQADVYYGTSDMSVLVSNNTRYHTPQDCNLQLYNTEDPKSHMKMSRSDKILVSENTFLITPNFVDNRKVCNVWMYTPCHKSRKQ